MYRAARVVRSGRRWTLLQRREMDQGKRPEHYTEQATCKHCGPIWLWLSSEILGCP